MEKITKFFMVKNISLKISPTNVMHPTFQQASEEATRLAKGAPGRTFVVLEALEGYMASPPVTRIPVSA